MRVLVCGGRDYNDRGNIRCTLSELHEKYKFTEVIHGGASGADHWGGEWGHDAGITTTVYKADWNAHGKAAGPIRNQRMLDEGKPDLVVAFPGGRGTAHMVGIAKRSGVKVIEVKDER